MSAGAIALGADHAGYELKEFLKAYLAEHDIPFEDFGCYSQESCDYPDVAYAVAQAVHKGAFLQGVLCCGSGVGVQIAANRFPNVRATVCYDNQLAMMSRRHNDANVICFGARYTAASYALEMLKTFMNTPFDGERHKHRVNKLALAEAVDKDVSPCSR